MLIRSASKSLSFTASFYLLFAEMIGGTSLPTAAQRKELSNAVEQRAVNYSSRVLKFLLIAPASAVGCFPLMTAQTCKHYNPRVQRGSAKTRNDNAVTQPQ